METQLPPGVAAVRLLCDWGRFDPKAVFPTNSIVAQWSHSRRAHLHKLRYRRETDLICWHAALCSECSLRACLLDRSDLAILTICRMHALRAGRVASGRAIQQMSCRAVVAPSQKPSGSHWNRLSDLVLADPETCCRQWYSSSYPRHWPAQESRQEAGQTTDRHLFQTIPAQQPSTWQSCRNHVPVQSHRRQASPIDPTAPLAYPQHRYARKTFSRVQSGCPNHWHGT